MRFLSLFALLLTSPSFADSLGNHDLLPVHWLPTGTYGCPAASFTVQARAADLDLPCAHGHIDYQPVIDSLGSFVAEGTWVQGPERKAGAKPARATFRGQLKGSSLWVQVMVMEPGESRPLIFGPLILGARYLFASCH